MITNRAKLRGGEKRQVTFSNHRPEWLSFDTSETSKQKSFEIMESFLNGLPIEPDSEKISDLLFRGVNHDLVVRIFVPCMKIIWAKSPSTRQQRWQIT